MRRTVKPPARSSAAAISLAPACSTIPAITGSSPRVRNAIPSAHVMITGNMKTQNTASGSRRNSRNRASVSSTSGCAAACCEGLVIAQLTARQRDEHILQGRTVRAQLAQRGVLAVQQVEQRRHGQMQLRGGQRSEEHTSELQSPCNLVCRLLLEKKKEK